jgi:putative redox protein
VAAKQPTVVDLVWKDTLRFDARVSKTALVVDSAGVDGPSPVELLGVALAGCMSMDLAYILSRGRYTYRTLTSTLTAQRSPDVPHRFTSVVIHFAIDGHVPRDAAERAIALSREKYCSVWHSMRQDIDLQVTFDLRP